MTTAYEKGRKGRSAGAAMDDNPYPPGTGNEHWWWRRGWIDGPVKQEGEADMSIERLTIQPTAGHPPAFVTVHHGIGGWNSSTWRWEADPNVPGGGYYEPQQTGFTNVYGTGERPEAVKEAEGWAQDEELPLWIPEQIVNLCNTCGKDFPSCDSDNPLFGIDVDSSRRDAAADAVVSCAQYQAKERQ